MKPIEYKLVDKPKYIKDEKEVIDINEWDDGKMIAFYSEKCADYKRTLMSCFIWRRKQQIQ